VLAASFIRAITSISETSVTLYQTTRRNNPEVSHLHSHRRENLKSTLNPSGSGHGLVADGCELVSELMFLKRRMIYRLAELLQTLQDTTLLTF
jgi:hypothetical protein